MVSVTFFGTSAATPSVERGFACIGIENEDDLTLLDCGDGSIRNLLRFGVDVRKISNILITHYHSDHLTGLTQIIESVAMRKRETELNVYGLPGLKEYFSTIERITSVAANRKFKINLNEVTADQRLEVDRFSVSTYEMNHTLPCLGYRIECDGKIVSYTGDTMPCSAAVELGRGADLFIHEATFLKKDIEKARQSKHSTPSEAGYHASSAKVKRLVLTHVNDRSEKPDGMLEESKPIFDNVCVASDGMKLDL